MGESQSGQEASMFRALGNGVSGAGQGSAGDRDLHNNGSIASQTARAYLNGGRSLVSEFGLYDTSSVGSNQHFGFSHGGNLYDEQSLAFAFEGMSFNSHTTEAPPTSHRNVPLINGHHPSGRVDGTLNQHHAPATRQDDSLRQFSVQHAMQNNDVEHQEQYHRFPPQFGNLSRSSELHSFDTNLGVPCHPSTASASSFQQMWPSQMYTSHDQNAGSNFMWQQNMGAQPYSIVQPNYVSPQMQRVYGFGASRHRSNEQSAVFPPAKAPSSYIGTPNFHWLENGYSYPNGAAFQKRRNSSSLNNTFTDSFTSTSYTGSSCGSGDFHHVQRAEKVFNPYGLHHQQADNLAHPYGLGFSHHQMSDKFNTASYQERILMRPDVGNSVKDFDLSPSAHFLNSPFLSSKSDKYKSIDEVMGRVCNLSKDQDACRFLQKVLTEGTQEDIDKIFSEIIDNVGDLMVDPTAHYLVQKILEVCTNEQRTHLIREITKAPITFHKVCCNMHGSRVVQKVIDTMNTSDQVSMVLSTLNTGAMRLMTDPYGNHVAVHCLENLLPDHKAFLLEAAASRYLQLSRDRHGCCVLQKCIEYSSGEKRNNLLSKITSNALALSEDQYGNYVLQFILTLNIEWATTRIVDELTGHFVNLSTQKCGSHVVENCIRLSSQLQSERIISELMHDPNLLHIILDQYGNFVIQTALKQCQGQQHDAFIEIIRPHIAVMQSNMYGKRVLSRTCLKNKHCRFGFY